ncbi:hypothetical protein JKP88DRAFT_331903 [Tribonema minus]|uniref:Dynein regulatory complex protein 9 n=1 Tax=Tribonema minus TaxID=303371 RepID=A0A835YQ64_9STRA|nr:hypothetical protein JKP88DRAFT_331903 [Tribonema minus]
MPAVGLLPGGGIAAPAASVVTPSKLCPEQSHRVIAVLDEAAQKLTFLDSITPDVLQHRDELSRFVGDEISRIIHEQRTLEERYETLIAQRSALKGLSNKTQYKEVQGEIQDVSRALRDSTRNLCRNLKDNPNISGNLAKIQRERGELIDLLHRTCRELVDEGQVHGVIKVVEEDRTSQMRQSELQTREAEATVAVKRLEKDLGAERAEHARQAQSHRETLAALKETLAEVKGRTSVDVKYGRKEHNARVSALLRVHRQAERDLDARVAERERARAVESAAHAETMAFLERKRAALIEELDAWEARYAAEHGELTRRHAALAAARDDGLARLAAAQARRAAEVAAEANRAREREEAARSLRQARELARRQNVAARRIQRLFHAHARLAAERRAGKGKKPKGGKGAGKKKKK